VALIEGGVGMRRLPVWVLGLTMASAAFAAEAPKPALAPHFAPIDYLVGHCWRARFPNGQHDVQCYEVLYGGKLVQSKHVVDSTPAYEGVALFTWDDAHDRLRFHYFNSDGGLSEGHFVPGDKPGEMSIPETHVTDDGRTIVMETLYRREGDAAYRVITREKTDKGWVERRDLRYVREPAK